MSPFTARLLAYLTLLIHLVNSTPTFLLTYLLTSLLTNLLTYLLTYFPQGWWRAEASSELDERGWEGFDSDDQRGRERGAADHQEGRARR